MTLSFVESSTGMAYHSRQGQYCKLRFAWSGYLAREVRSSGRCPVLESSRCSSRSNSMTRRRSCRASLAVTRTRFAEIRDRVPQLCGIQTLLAAPAAPRCLIYRRCADQRQQSRRRRPALTASSPIARPICQRIRMPRLHSRCTHSNIARHFGLLTSHREMRDEVSLRRPAWPVHG